MIEKRWKPSWLVKHAVPVNSPDTFNSSDGQIGMGVRVLTTELPPWQHVSLYPQNCVCFMMLVCDRTTKCNCHTLIYFICTM